MIRKATVATLLFTFLTALAALAPMESQAQSTTTVLIDINTAPIQILEGIVEDEEMAQRIVDNRPYANKRQLLTRGLMSMEKYDAIKDRIVARRVVNPGDSQ